MFNLCRVSPYPVITLKNLSENKQLFFMSGNIGLRQLAPLIIVSVEAGSSARFARTQKHTDNTDSSVMKVQEARCQAAGRGIGFLSCALESVTIQTSNGFKYNHIQAHFSTTVFDYI